jgi:hypothetical protein
MHLLLTNPTTLSLSFPPLVVVQAERVLASKKNNNNNNAIIARAQSVLNELSANETYAPRYNLMDATYNETEDSVGNAKKRTTTTLRSRVWRVQVLLPSSHKKEELNVMHLSEIQEWNNSNAIVASNLFHSSIDGVRWKSSNGIFKNNTWFHPLSNSATGLEITPLRSYMEGPYRVDNVSIVDNIFIGKNRSDEMNNLVTVCEGMSHQRSKNPWSVCKDVVVANNTYPYISRVHAHKI